MKKYKVLPSVDMEIAGYNINKYEKNNLKIAKLI